MTGFAGKALQIPQSLVDARRVVRRVTVVVIVFILLAVIGIPAFMFWRLSRAFANRDAQQLSDSAAILLPQNYKAAGLYLARLAQSDPALWVSDDPDDPPDWLPSELGSIGQRELSISSSGASSGWGGGGDDDLGRSGLLLQLDPKASTSSNACYILTYSGFGSLDGKYPARGGEYRFSIAKSDRISEAEFVERGLAELARRQAAYAAGTQSNVYGDDPVWLRQRLLAQHPAIAIKLGLAAAPATSTTTAPYLSLRV